MLLIAALSIANTLTGPVLIDGALVSSHRLLVKVEDNQALADLQAAGARLVRYMPQIHWAVVDSGPMAVSQMHDLLPKVAGVQEVQYDRAAKIAYTPNDPQYPNEWHLPAIHADTAWDVSLGSAKVTIAIMDTGVDRSHPDLAPNLWVNSDEIPANGVDDDGNGYVDDINGYDFVANDAAPDDEQGHGTCCAGIAAAVGNNALGMSGVAPRAKIMVVRAGNADGYFYDSANVPGYLYAADNGARVLSMSFYSDRVSQPERDAIDYCVAHGCLPIAAAGNDATVYSYYPAAYENTLAVAATNSNGTKASFSDYGSWVDVSAPGVGLTATTRGGGYTNGFSGTSGACPVVAGTAALLFGARPAATPQRVRAALEDTASLTDQAPYGQFSNYGLINARAAMDVLLAREAAIPKPTVIRYVTPIGTDPLVSGVSARVYGRGFIGGSFLAPTATGRAKILGRGRDYLDYLIAKQTGTVSITRDGTPVGTVTSPESSGLVWPLVEASAQGSTLTGGFFQTLLPNDNSMIVVTPRGDGTMIVQATMRRVPSAGVAKLVLRRALEGGTGCNETVQFYDWSSASYPYGNWINVSSGAAPTTQTSSTITIPAPGRTVDFEGTVYMRILISGGTLPSSARLKLDAAYLKQ